MKNYQHDSRIVMTLDAGGTNFVFNAIAGNKELIEPIKFPSCAHDLEQSLKNIIEGFTAVKAKLSDSPVAISFAFPGPCDYPNGIVGDLGNLPGYRGGVALAAMLQDHFHIPVFLNNDGDLFAYGEALAGMLPKINHILKEKGSIKQYKNLLGVTLGTGFGAGIVIDGQLLMGDNAAAGEIWISRNKKYNRCFIEESVAIRAIIRVYKEHATCPVPENIQPKDICEIADGIQAGDAKAAKIAFEEFGEMIGDALANAITLIDGLIVIGGGLANAYKYFMPSIIKELNSTIETLNGDKLDRLEVKAFNLEDAQDLEKFCKGEQKEITVPFSNRKIQYDPLKRIGVGINAMDTSHAVSVGAYNFALNELDKKEVL